MQEPCPGVRREQALNALNAPSGLPSKMDVCPFAERHHGRSWSEAPAANSTGPAARFIRGPLKTEISLVAGSSNQHFVMGVSKLPGAS